MIWLGDGHTSLLSKATVVLGVILSVGGIGVLRFMLFKSFKDARVARRGRRLNLEGAATGPSHSLPDDGKS